MKMFTKVACGSQENRHAQISCMYTYTHIHISHKCTYILNTFFFNSIYQSPKKKGILFYIQKYTVTII